MRQRDPIRAIFLTSLLVLPSPRAAASMPSVSVPYRLGIARIGFLDKSGEVAFSRLEKRIERWIENEPGLGARASALGSLDRTSMDSRVAELENTLTRALLLPAESSEARPLSAALEQGAAALDLAWELTPFRQRIWVARAVLAWRQGDRAALERDWARAIALSPEGTLSDSALSGLAAGERSRFRTATRDIPTGVVQGCSIDLEVFPAEAVVALDGFVMGSRRHFDLLRGREYRAWVRAEGYGSRELILDCRRAGQWIESLRLERGRDLDETAVARLRFVSRSEGVSSLVFAKPLAPDRFGLFLYTPGVGVDSIPTETPLTFAALTETPLDARMPILSDLFSDLVARHRLAPLRLGFGQSGEPGYTTSQGQAAVIAPPAWYEKRAFWWVVGGVGAGLATALILGGGQTRATPGFTAKVD